MPAAHRAPRTGANVGVPTDPTFPDHHAILWNKRSETLGGAKGHREGSKIAVVDANKPGAERQGTSELGLVVDLDENVHTESTATWTAHCTVDSCRWCRRHSPVARST